MTEKRTTEKGFVSILYSASDIIKHSHYGGFFI